MTAQVEEELFSRRLASVEKPTSSALAIEFGQIEQVTPNAVEIYGMPLFEMGVLRWSCFLSDTECCHLSALRVFVQNGKKGALDTEGDSQNRILSGEVAVRSTARVGSPEQALGSSATLLLSPGTQNRSAGDVQVSGVTHFQLPPT